MTPRAGQKVVCIDAGGASMLTMGRVYTVQRVTTSLCRWRGKIGPWTSVSLYETEPEPRFSGFCSERFRPRDERETDIKSIKKALRVKCDA
jgi:hypothetical protein